MPFCASNVGRHHLFIFGQGARAKSMSAIDLASAADAAVVLFFDGQRDDDHAVVLNTNFRQRLQPAQF
jgi:hypothetical protein